MDTQWIITEIDGQIASVSTDYRHLAHIGAAVAQLPPAQIGAVSTRKISTPQLLEWASGVKWEDLRLFGTPFQIKVWKTLFELPRRLYSYTELAALADNPAGVRAVAHALALNPVAYIIPCHLVVPKESLDKVKEIRATAEKTLFRGTDLYLLNTIEVGAYAYGADLKREFIKHQLA